MCCASPLTQWCTKACAINELIGSVMVWEGILRQQLLSSSSVGGLRLAREGADFDENRMLEARPHSGCRPFDSYPQLFDFSPHGRVRIEHTFCGF